MQAGACSNAGEAEMAGMIQASLKAGGLDVDGDDMSEAVAYMQQVRPDWVLSWAALSGAGVAWTPLPAS